MISGRHDPVTTLADAESICARVRNARHQPLDAAHLANVEAADAFTAAMVEFLAGEDRSVLYWLRDDEDTLCVRCGRAGSPPLALTLAWAFAPADLDAQAPLLPVRGDVVGARS